MNVADGSGTVALASTPYLISEPTLEGLRRGSGRDLDAFLAPHTAMLVKAFRAGAQAQALLIATASLTARLDEFRRRRSSALARLFGLEASLLLAAGHSADDAQRAFHRATDAVSIARRVESTSADRFIAEHEMIAAVSLKASGEIDESISYVRRAANEVGAYALGIPLVRQEVLMLQDAAEFDHLLERAHEYRSSNSREYYRTIKRVLEFKLNHGQFRAAQLLVEEFVWGYARSRAAMGVLDRVSLLKNLGQLFGARGEFTRALSVLGLAAAIANAATLEGQARQIGLLRSAFAAGERDGVLVTFELAR